MVRCDQRRVQDFSRQAFLKTTTWRAEEIDLGCEDRRWIKLACDIDQLWAAVLAVLNLGVLI